MAVAVPDLWKAPADAYPRFDDCRNFLFVGVGGLETFSGFGFEIDRRGENGLPRLKAVHISSPNCDKQFFP
jgi:hypothetical protein